MLPFSQWNSNYAGNASYTMPNPQFLTGNSAFMNNTASFPNIWSTPQATSYSASSSGSSSKKTKAEEITNRENKKIISLFENMIKSKYFSEDDAKFLKEDLQNAKKIKNIDERNEELKSMYDYHQDEIFDFLTSQKTKDIKFGDKSLTSNLDSIGYERSHTTIDDGISALHSAIESLGNTNGSFGGSDIAAEVKQGSSIYNVLDIVSSYNTAYSNENLAQALKNKYNNAFNKRSVNSGMREEVEKFAKNLALKLAQEAEKMAENIKDPSVRNSLSNKATALRDAKLEDDDFADKFNSLYAITRILAARTLGGKIEAEYGKIDSEKFNENMFVSATENDLENEGLNLSVKSVSGMFTSLTLKSKTYNGNSLLRDRNIDKFDPELQLKSLTTNNLLKATEEEIVVIDELLDENSTDENSENSYLIYEETSGTGEGETKRMYVQIDGYFYEVFTDSKGERFVSDEPVDASQIQDAVYNKKSAELRQQKSDERKAEEIKSNNFDRLESILGKHNTEITDKTIDINGLNLTVFKDITTNKEYVVYNNDVYEIDENGISGEALTAGSLILKISKEGYENGKKMGKSITTTIKGKTADKSYDKVNDALKNVNKTNVVGLIEGSNGRILNALDRENDSKNPITFENKKRIAQALLQRAKELGLSDSDEYKKIEKVLAKSEYQNTSEKDKKFSQKSLGQFSWGWGITGIIFTAATLLSVIYGTKNVLKSVNSVVNTVKSKFNPDFVAKMQDKYRFLGRLMGYAKDSPKIVLTILPGFTGGVGVYKTYKSLVITDHDMLDENMAKLCKSIKNSENTIKNYELEHEA